MRTALTLVLAFVLAFLQATPDAHARRRAKARANDGPFSIAVAPFDGDRAGGRTISEAMELELELIETVLVKGDRWLRSDLRRAGDAGYEPDALRRIMKKRKVDILVRGKRAGSGVDVYVFGADGRPRFIESFPLPDDPDESARDIVESIRPVLLRWPRAKVVEPPGQAPVVSRRAVEPAPEPEEEAPRVDEDDLFVDFEDDGGGVRDSALPEPDEMPAGEGEDEPPVRRRTSEPPAEERRPRRALSDDEPANRREQPRRRMLLDDGDDEDARRPLLSDDGDRRRTLTMADVTDDEGDRAPLLHWIAVSAGLVGGGWYYEFAAATDIEDDFKHQLWDYGGMARVSVWPIEYVGLDATVGARTFSVNAEGIPVVPAQLRVIGLTAAASARARYPFKLGDLAFAPGVRAGYRYWGSNVDPQTHAEDKRAYTIIPGWQMHAVSVGAELFGSYVLEKQWRFEAELHLEPLPLVRYEETPDNPAVYARPLGGNGTLILRIPVYAPVFVELHGNTTLALVTWEGGPGTRLSQKRRDGEGNRLRVDGGESLNVQFGGGVAIGASF